MADQEKNGLNRREFLRKAAITGTIAWAIPVVQSVAATPAYAQQLSPGCPQSDDPAGSGGSCTGTCHAVCQANTSPPTDCGTSCASVCQGVCVPSIGCPPAACVAGCWSCSGSPGASNCTASLNTACG